MTPTALVRHALRESLFLRFLLVGGSVAVAYSLATTLVTMALPLPPAVLAVAVWVCFIPLGYACQARFAFTGRTARRGGGALYAMAQGLSMGIVALAAWALASGDSWADVAVYLGASAIAAVASYVINRRLVFAG
ncbi:MAG: GtrA family protein [Rubellimicrobium sp.]|nr:GtrA family protein [Rubellimicrobium sp.]